MGILVGLAQVKHQHQLQACSLHPGKDEEMAQKGGSLGDLGAHQGLGMSGGWIKGPLQPCWPQAPESGDLCTYLGAPAALLAGRVSASQAPSLFPAEDPLPSSQSQGGGLLPRLPGVCSPAWA